MADEKIPDEGNMSNEQVAALNFTIELAVMKDELIFFLRERCNIPAISVDYLAEQLEVMANQERNRNNLAAVLRELVDYVRLSEGDYDVPFVAEPMYAAIQAFALTKFPKQDVIFEVEPVVPQMVTEIAGTVSQLFPEESPSEVQRVALDDMNKSLDEVLSGIFPNITASLSQRMRLEIIEGPPQKYEGDDRDWLIAYLRIKIRMHKILATALTNRGYADLEVGIQGAGMRLYLWIQNEASRAELKKAEESKPRESLETKNDEQGELALNKGRERYLAKLDTGEMEAFVRENELAPPEAALEANLRPTASPPKTPSGTPPENT